jgi:hypothetical protein
MANILETGMLVLFGLSWPFNIARSWKSRTAKGKSIIFSFLILLGYISGISSKIIVHNISYVIFVYLADLLMVCVDILLYFRNLKLDKAVSKVATGAEIFGIS